MANTTIYDVAGAAKVSLATVSRVLNNPEKVNPATRERVLKVIKELGYRPNAIARGLASRKTTTVGVVVSDITRASTSQLLGGIIDIAKKYKYSIKIFSMSGESDAEDSIRTVVAEQVDGILLLNDELDDADLKKVIDRVDDAAIPMVYTNAGYEDQNHASVSIDYAQATYEITKELIEKGRKNIYLLSTVRKYAVNTQKEAGYLKAVQEAGLPEKIFRTSGDLSINTPHFMEYFANNPVDAAVAVRDSIAVSFMNANVELGRAVPDDVMVVGAQNTKYAQLARPQLTCIDTPVYDIGAVAMRLLTKYMKKEETETTKVLLPHTIVYRGSTK